MDSTPKNLISAADSEDLGYTDEEQIAFMREALHEAERAEALGEVPVGCVLVHRELKRVVARGCNATNRTRNASRHCELEAIDAYLREREIRGSDPQQTEHEHTRATPKEDLGRCDIFVTCEPCIMCAAALRIAGTLENWGFTGR